MSKDFIVILQNRGVISIAGEDRYSFLNGLVSNDLSALQANDSVYACLLSRSGKFLYDMFITADSDKLYLECEGNSRLTSLLSLLKRYQLRSKIILDVVSADIPVYAGFDIAKPKSTDFHTYNDPRHTQAGWRLIDWTQSFKPETLNKALDLFERWDKHRLKLHIPDGSRDMIPDKSTLIECGIDKLNGISFTKGCYVGQEITARMHHLGLAKKHLYTVQIAPNRAIESGQDITTSDGKYAGEMRSLCITTKASHNNYGMALLKDNLITSLESGICSLGNGT